MTMAISCLCNSYYYCYDYTNYVGRERTCSVTRDSRLLSPHPTQSTFIHSLSLAQHINEYQSKVCSHHHLEASAQTKRFGRHPFLSSSSSCGSRYSVNPRNTTIVHVNPIVESILRRTDHLTDIAHSLSTFVSNFNNTRILQNGSRAYTFIFRMSRHAFV